MAKLERLKKQKNGFYIHPPIYFQQKKGVCRAHCTFWLKSALAGGNYVFELSSREGFKAGRLKDTAVESWRVVAPAGDSADAVLLQDELFAKSGGPRPSDEQRAAMSWGRILPGGMYGCYSTISGLDQATMPETIAEFGKTYRGTLLTLSTELAQGGSSTENPLFGGYTHHAIATACYPHLFALFDPCVGNFAVAPDNALGLLNAYWGDVTDVNDAFKYKDNALTIEHTGAGSSG
jgi:hypothetical protein